MAFNLRHVSVLKQCNANNSNATNHEQNYANKKILFLAVFSPSSSLVQDTNYRLVHIVVTCGVLKAAVAKAPD